MSKKKDNKKVIKKIIQSPRGMKDILPIDYPYYDYLLKNAKKIFEYYNYQRIETPVLEKAELFIRGVGKETDLVHKEMYLLKTKDEGELLALRPEGTAPVSRAYIEHAFFNEPQPVKFYYFMPFFRHEKPQAGRFRQFYQLGLEALGSNDPALDVQIILLSWVFLESLGFNKKNLVFKINSIGCHNCRSHYIKNLVKYYNSKSKSICVDCKTRIKNNPLRVLDCKNEKCQLVKQSAPNILDYLCEDCSNHFKSVLEGLEHLDIPYILDKTLVRGLDYYTRTVFEVFKSGGDKLLALGGGGRYDKLLEILKGPKAGGVGVAFGVERLIEEMKAMGKKFPLPHYDVFLIQLGDKAKNIAFTLLERFRKEGILVGENLGKESLKNQLRYANRLKAKYVLILGQQEVIDETIILKDMTSGLQEVVPLDKIEGVLKKYLSQNI
ncbi:MAG: histidine--tRNA ligase [Minisyncoccia bacterium]